MIGAFLTYLQSECNRSQLTSQTYQTCLEEFEHYIKGRDDALDWVNIDQDVVRDWMVDLMERGNTPRTICKKLSALKTFYRFLLQRGWVEVNPVHALQGPKQDKPLPVFVREAEMNELLDGNYFENNLKGRQDRLVLLILYSTGIRRSELSELDWADVDLAQRQLKVTGKRNKQRIVPFGKELHDAIAEYALQMQALDKEYDEQALLVNLRTGRRITGGQIYQTVKYYLSFVTTLKKRSPHVLRHTFATTMLNNEANLQSVKELLGHENLATTEVYTHTTFEELRKMYNQAHPRAK